jgi:hypothetical protein
MKTDMDAPRGIIFACGIGIGTLLLVGLVVWASATLMQYIG